MITKRSHFGRLNSASLEYDCMLQWAEIEEVHKYLPWNQIIEFSPHWGRNTVVGWISCCPRGFRPALFFPLGYFAHKCEAEMNKTQATWYLHCPPHHNAALHFCIDLSPTMANARFTVRSQHLLAPTIQHERTQRGSDLSKTSRLIF